MPRGRPRLYDEPIVITLKCERRLRDVMFYLKYSDRDVYTKGAQIIMDEREGDLKEEHIQVAIQVLRQQMAEIQERIAHTERLMMDARIKREQTARIKKKRIILLTDERGQQIEAVSAD
jgi:hypothetical protein